MQTNDEKKIANCPFCRATAQLYIRNNQYTVRCNNHNCIAYDIEPHFISADSAIDAWNARETPNAEWFLIEWLLLNNKVTKCPSCGGTRNLKTLFGWNFCPYCGEKM
nr:MAG TPA: restriction alleviation protein [Caudoviricetes sp.]